MSTKIAKKLESAFNEEKIDGINSKLRESIEIWSPYRKGLSKSDLLKSGMKNLGIQFLKPGVVMQIKNIIVGFVNPVVIEKLHLNQPELQIKQSILNKLFI